MNAASYIGRVGGLAVAFGVGTAIITGQGIAVATADGDTPSDNSQTGDGSGNTTATVNDNAPDDVGKIIVKPSGTADVTGRHSATDTTPTSVTATSIVKRLSDSAEDAVKRVTDVLQNAAGATTTGDKNTPLTTSSSGQSSSHANRRAERLAARTTLPDPSPIDSGADNVVANGFVNRAPAIKDWLASPPADTAPPVSTQPSLWTPPRILDAPLFTMRAAPTASVSVKRPNLLAAVLGNVFNPFAGTAPNAPTPESPLSWVLAGAARRQLSGAAVNLDALAPIPISPTLVNGYTITPAYPATVTGIYNLTTPPPGVNGSIQGYQPFNVVDADGNTGTFYAWVSTAPYLTPHLPNASAGTCHPSGTLRRLWCSRFAGPIARHGGSAGRLGDQHLEAGLRRLRERLLRHRLTRRQPRKRRGNEYLDEHTYRPEYRPFLAREGPGL